LGECVTRKYCNYYNLTPLEHQNTRNTHFYREGGKRMKKIPDDDPFLGLPEPDETDLRDHQEERAAILEYCAGLSRHEAERRAGIERQTIK